MNSFIDRNHPVISGLVSEVVNGRALGSEARICNDRDLNDSGRRGSMIGNEGDDDGGRQTVTIDKGRASTVERDDIDNGDDRHTVAIVEC